MEGLQNLTTSRSKLQTAHSVTTASGERIQAIGKGDLFSVLAAHDKHPDSQFLSTTEIRNIKVGKAVILPGILKRFGGLFKIAV
ncbi:hypothetical protein Zmor_017911 [Zophobas morio]|uniref:Uncharacterized protein n=1 Tax=Zophobas morio TaxID=2755281 RepID=A0AA38MD17_9CUCU|nr:hypothetical protein Zmor_017911 [Zophobas morio]